MYKFISADKSFSLLTRLTLCLVLIALFEISSCRPITWVTEGIADLVEPDPMGQFSDDGRLFTSKTPFFCVDQDLDRDGLQDDWETQFAEAVKPYFLLDEDEDWIGSKHHVADFVRVTPITKGEKEYILVFYLATWSRDYGRLCEHPAALCKSHNGDVERVVMAWEVLDDRNLQLETVYTSAHEGAETDHSGTWRACAGCNTCIYAHMTSGEQFFCVDELEFQDNRLILQVSEDKHAIYPKKFMCENAILVDMSVVADICEDCGEGPLLGGDYPLPVFNIGEPWEGGWLIDDLDDPESPYYSTLHMMFPGEKVWSADKFCGGLGCDNQSPHSIGYNTQPPESLLDLIGFTGVMPSPHVCSEVNP